MAQQIATAVRVLHQPSAQLELAGLAPLPPQQRAEGSSTSNDLGFELGFDHARHGVVPPVAHLAQQSPLLQGWQAGMATFGPRSRTQQRVSRHTRLWLQLRTHAWLRGRSFEGMEVTPNYLQQIATDFCPVLRLRLDADTASVDRVRDDAGYAAGNLAVMSRGANAAKARHGWASAAEVVASVEKQGSSAGLDAQAWRRVAVLCSFVTELPHEEAAQIPLHVLPPNRLRLFNPIQALQALVTRQLATPGWSERLARLEALLPGNEALRADFNRFVLALVPRVLRQQGALVEPQEIRWALEDAWSQPLVQKRWTRFALQLSAAQAEALVQRAAAKRLCPVHVQRHAETRATEGWALEQGGFRAAAH